MSIVSKSGSGSAQIGAAPVVPGPGPDGPIFQEAHRDSVASATDDSSWIIPVAPDASLAGPAQSLCVVSADNQAELDAMTDQDVVDKAEVTVPLTAANQDGATPVTASIPNDLPAGAVTEFFRAVIVFADPATA